MRFTAALLQGAGKRNNIKSLALSVHFMHPKLGMKEYEILSRATAYLLSVDPPEKSVKEGPYGHLEASDALRKDKEFRRTKGYSQAGGPGRQIMDLGWLEFAPKEIRPEVHVVCSSHVLSPFLWKDYYPQDWLSIVRQEHCSYSLEVFDPDQPEKALAKLPLNSEPYHHPEGRDIALVHFREEKTSLKLLKSLGVQVLHLRDTDKLYEKGEKMFFDGFTVSERNAADGEAFAETETKAGVDSKEDSRVFYPYQETGQLAFHTEDRFFAATPTPLPEGMCGAPAVDEDGALCGTVEGIVPTDHKNKSLAGSAAFMPSFVMKHFIDYVERGITENMMPRDLFLMVEAAKKTNSVGGGIFRKDKDGNFTVATDWASEYDRTIAGLKKKYSQKEYDAIMKVIEDERDQVLETFDKEGGDLDEIIKKTRMKTLQIRAMVQDQLKKQPKETERQKSS